MKTKREREREREKANFAYKFVQKTNAIEQTLMALIFYINFASDFFTQFSPIDPFEIEL